GDRLGEEAPVVECSRAKLGPVEAWAGDGHAVRLLLGRDDCFGRDEAARRGTLNEGKLLRRHCLVIGASGIANVVGCRSLELVAARIALSRIEQTRYQGMVVLEIARNSSARRRAPSLQHCNGRDDSQECNDGSCWHEQTSYPRIRHNPTPCASTPHSACRRLFECPISSTGRQAPSSTATSIPEFAGNIRTKYQRLKVTISSEESL